MKHRQWAAFRRRLNQDLLRHEQLHFDLTELSARRIRTQFEDLPRLCATPAGDGPISAAVADITGIVAASAVVVGTFVAFGRRRKILSEYHRQMDAKREELVAAIEQQLQHAIDLFYTEIGSVFSPLRAFCAAERRRFDPLLSRVREVEKTLAVLSAEIARSRQ